MRKKKLLHRYDYLELFIAFIRIANGKAVYARECIFIFLKSSERSIKAANTQKKAAFGLFVSSK
jgi:hypothetical protein